jgi:hypothetical protein
MEIIEGSMGWEAKFKGNYSAILNRYQWLHLSRFFMSLFQKSFAST